MRVGIIGTGNIGTDLLYKLLKIPGCKVVAFVGRRESTKKLPSGDEGEFFFDVCNNKNVNKNGTLAGHRSRDDDPRFFWFDPSP